jgi:hypothetical protein
MGNAFEGGVGLRSSIQRPGVDRKEDWLLTFSSAPAGVAYPLAKGCSLLKVVQRACLIMEAESVTIVCGYGLYRRILLFNRLYFDGREQISQQLFWRCPDFANVEVDMQRSSQSC